MTLLFTESEVLTTVPGLTSQHLATYVQARIVLPMRTEKGPMFAPSDLARMELLCELTNDYGLDDDALGLVMSLLDQLHAARRDLRALAAALADEPADLRARIARAWGEGG